MIKIKTVTLPAFLATALVNGDTSGLSDEDMPWLAAAHAYVAPGRIVSITDEEAWFAWHCALPGYRLGGDVLNYIVHYTEE